MASTERIFFEAFNELATCRPVHFESFGSIPWTAVIRYAEHLGLDERATEIFVRRIRVLDAEWLTWHEENKPKPVSPQQERQPSPRQRLKG